MNISRFSKAGIVLLSCVLSFSTFQAASEDIDLFSTDPDSNVNNPNVLIVLDNSANWSRMSQQWLEVDALGQSLVQGQSEVEAIKLVINELDDSVNVGLMEYVTGGNAADADSGYVRYDIRPMNATHKAALSTRLDTIYNNINDPTEKRPQSNPFGTLFWDVYNYLAGENHSNSGTGTPASLADPEGYTTNYSRFESPLNATDTCTRTIVIFIGNNVQAGPTPDADGDASNALAAVGGSTAQIPHAAYTVTTTPTKTRARTSACHPSLAACTLAENAIDSDGNGISDCQDNGFSSCACRDNVPDPVTLAPTLTPDVTACPLQHFSVVGSHTSGTTVTISDNGPSPGPSFTNQNTGTTTACIKPAPADGTAQTCPATSTTSTPGPGTNQTTSVRTQWTSCYKSGAGTVGDCNGGRARYPIFGNGNRHTVVTETTTVTNQTYVGQTSACYEDISVCSTVGFADCTNPAVYNNGCACALGPPPAGTLPPSTAGCAAGSKSKFGFWGDSVSSVATATGTFTAAPSGPYMVDEWARFLRQTGVPIPGLPGAKAQVTTYTIDVFRAQQDPVFSSLLFNTARVGGGKYFQARSKADLINSLRDIFDEVQAVNSAFSSASLPVSSTNRAQNENQVFIGLFRPDRTKDPLWFGNMKRYQLARFGAEIDLADSRNPPQRAINNQTGFITDCAQSFWTTDSGDFWFDVLFADDPDAASACSSIAASQRWSDLPDGPFVEKGAVADVLRKRATARNIESLSGSSLVDFNSTNFPALNTNTVKFIRGEDLFDEDGDANQTEIRATIHGDVVHSRPLPVNYGDADNNAANGIDPGVVVYYGANDGTFRSVKANTGEELWSFVAPEHFGAPMDRLKNSGQTGTPLIRYFGDTNPGRAPKDYFFDGSSSVFQTLNNSKVRVFTTLRRGGRKIYAFNVNDPANPVHMWNKGCPNQTNNTGCADTDGDLLTPSPFDEIGQTWSVPAAAFVKGYSSLTEPDGDPNPNATPVLIMGGGYDGGEGVCEDQNTGFPTGCARGGGVYMLDAETGDLLRYFDFGGRGVAADISLIDVNFDRMVDYAYAADLGGNIYRIDFINPDGTVKAQADWSASRIAFTDGDGRKFLFTPTPLNIGSGTVYVAIASGDREHPLRTQYPFDDKNGDTISDGGVVNRFYVFKDKLADVNAATVLDLDDTVPTTGMVDNTNASQAILPGAPPASGAGSCASGTPNLALCKQGWFINLNENGQGEQGVTSAIIISGFALFSTNRPTPTSTTECTTSLGEARGYILNLFTGQGAIGVAGASGGERSSVFTGGGLPPSPVIATVPIGTGSDTRVETIVIGGAKKGGGESCPICGQKWDIPVRSRRTPIYWFKTGDTDKN